MPGFHKFPIFEHISRELNVAACVARFLLYSVVNH